MQTKEQPQWRIFHPSGGEDETKDTRWPIMGGDTLSLPSFSAVAVAILLLPPMMSLFDSGHLTHCLPFQFQS